MKHHKREFNSNQSTEESSISKSIGKFEKAKRLSNKEHLEPNTSNFYSLFESYNGKSYEELLKSEASSEILPIPKRISNKEQRTPFKLVKVIRYLSAGAAFVLVFTALLAMQPFKLTRTHLEQSKNISVASEVRPAVLRLSDEKKNKLLDRSGKFEVETVAVVAPKKEEKVQNVVLSANTDNTTKVNNVASEEVTTSTSTVELAKAKVQDAQQSSQLNSPQQGTSQEVLANDESSEQKNETFASQSNKSEDNKLVISKPIENVEATQAPSEVVPATEFKQESQVTETIATTTQDPTTLATEVKETSANQELVNEATEQQTTNKPLDYVIDGDTIDLDKSSNSSNNNQYKHSDKEMDMLYHLVAAEAGHDWDYNGQLRIARVVANRLKSGRYGNTLEDVITYPQQFTPVMDGTYMNKTPSDIQIKAAQDAMNGAGSEIFDDKVIGFCTRECYDNNSYFRDETQLKVVEEYNGVVFFKFAWDD